MTLTVIVITLKRPEELEQCVRCLARQEPVPNQVIVVDGSPDDLSRRVVEESNEHRVLDVLYLRNDIGGFMTQSRNIALHHATGDIIAFLDDDAFAHEDWSRELLETYGDDFSIAAVGGRALNNIADEANIGLDKIGRFDRNGVLYGYFGADPGKILEVDHLIGCNMSMRRETLARLGGFREAYPGSSLREETDPFLRIKRMKGRILYNPRVLVTHVGAPQVVGRRFDLRYEYYSQRNHLVMLISNFGFSAPILRRYLFTETRRFLRRFPERLCRRERHPLVVLTSVGVYIAATFVGLASGIKLLRQSGVSPMRQDEEGKKIRVLLSQTLS